MCAVLHAAKNRTGNRSSVLIHEYIVVNDEQQLGWHQLLGVCRGGDISSAALNSVFGVLCGATAVPVTLVLPAQVVTSPFLLTSLPSISP